MSISQEHIRKLQYAVACDRDESAYRKIFILFHNPLIRFVTTLVQSEEIAEEIYSDTMLKIWLMETKLAEIAHLRQFLFKVCKNSALNHLRKSAKVKFIALDDIILDRHLSKSPEELLLESEFQKKVGSAISTLPPKCQLVYRLIKEDEFNYKQTAEILDLSVNTIERHMNTALKKIVSFLKPYVSPVK